MPRVRPSLCLQYIPPRQHPLHQRPHAQLAGDGQGLVQQGHGLLAIARLVALEQGIGVVAAGPGQLGPIAGLAAEGQGVLEVGRRLVQVARGLRQEAEDAVRRYVRREH